MKLITLKRKLVGILDGIQGDADADNAATKMVENAKATKLALIELAETGAEAPPRGIPQKYQSHYKAVEARLSQKDEQISGRLSEKGKRALQQKMVAARNRDPILQKDPFRLSAGIRSAGNRRVTVLLKRNHEIRGPRHQTMMQRLKNAAGAQQMEPQIDGDEYRVVLAPVADMNAFIRRSILVPFPIEMMQLNHSHSQSIPRSSRRQTVQSDVGDLSAEGAQDRLLATPA